MNEEAVRIRHEEAGGTLWEKEMKWEETKKKERRVKDVWGFNGGWDGGLAGGVDFLQFNTGGSYFLGIRWSDQYSFPAIY